MSAHEETPKPAPEGREGNGRFTKGNAGGPGNPFARRVAQMRSLALQVVTDDDLSAILKKMVELAREGDVPAAKLVLQYTLGKPAEQPHPDLVDRHEMQAWLANGLQPGDRAALASLPLDVVLGAARVVCPANTRQFAADLLDGLHKIEEQQAHPAVNKRPKRSAAKPTSADPAVSLSDTETIRLVNQPGADRTPTGQRAANDGRS
ncbi:MAG: hypothetical protein U0797_09680 [Gemmataceae bacterium]